MLSQQSAVGGKNAVGVSAEGEARKGRIPYLDLPTMQNISQYIYA